MQYAPTETANAVFSLMLNLLDFLVKKGTLTEGERMAVIIQVERNLSEYSTTGSVARPRDS